jgi:ATP-dependent Clp protease protease subunit
VVWRWVLLSLPSSGVGRLAFNTSACAGASTSTGSQYLDELYANHTGQKLEEIEKAMDRDKFLETDETKAFGLIDEVFDKRPDAGEEGGTGTADITPAWRRPSVTSSNRTPRSAFPRPDQV